MFHLESLRKDQYKGPHLTEEESQAQRGQALTEGHTTWLVRNPVLSSLTQCLASLTLSAFFLPPRAMQRGVVMWFCQQPGALDSYCLCLACSQPRLKWHSGGGETMPVSTAARGTRGATALWPLGVLIPSLLGWRWKGNVLEAEVGLAWAWNQQSKLYTKKQGRGKRRARVGGSIVTLLPLTDSWREDGGGV